MDTEKFTDDEIITLNTVRKYPCISEGGECHIVSGYTISTIAGMSRSPARPTSTFSQLPLRLISGWD